MTRHGLRRALAGPVIALGLALGCTPVAPQRGPGALSTPTPPAATRSAPPVTPSATGTPSAATRTVPFPTLDLATGTASGDVTLRLEAGVPAGPRIHVCDGYIVRLEPVPGELLVSCIQGGAFAVFRLALPSGAVSRVGGVDGPAIWGETRDTILFVSRGGCAPDQTDCPSRLVRRDLASGATAVIDERVGVLTDFRTTAEGPTIWRARNAVGFVRPDAEVGTFLVRGTSLVRFSGQRLVAGSAGRWLLESEETHSYNSGCCSYVLRRTDREVRLTPPAVPNERAVALLADGRIVAFRPEGDGPAGTMVVYPAGGSTPEREDRGAFTPFRVLVSGDWIIGVEYAGAPALTLRAYRIADGAFASAPGGTITALAVLAGAR